MFEIDEKSGEIKVKVPLDRDPPNGRPIWSFNVLATDNGGKNGLDGYAGVPGSPSINEFITLWLIEWKIR